MEHPDATVKAIVAMYVLPRVQKLPATGKSLGYSICRSDSGDVFAVNLRDPNSGHCRSSTPRLDSIGIPNTPLDSAIVDNGCDFVIV
jgi:hypothetical protein